MLRRPGRADFSLVPLIACSHSALGLVLAFALATGLNLGMWIAIRSLDDYGHSLVAPGAALCVALCAIALFLSGLLTAAIAA